MNITKKITSSMFATVALLLFAGNVSAQSANITLDAPQENVPVNQEFTVVVDISGVSDLGAYDFELSFDKNILEVVNVSPGNYLQSTGNTANYNEAINNPIGKVIFGGYSQGNNTGPSGNGSLHAIVFRGKTSGTSYLDFDYAAGYTMTNGSNITFNASNSSVVIGTGGSTCSCGAWSIGTCGTGTCSNTQLQQARICNPLNCDVQTRCVTDASCSVGVTISPVVTQPPYQGPEGLMAHWSFNGSGSTAVDQTGNGHDGVISGATRVNSRDGKALRFNGTDHFVRVPDSDLFDISNKDVTIAVWFKADRNQQARWPRFLDHFTGGDVGEGWRLGLDDAGERGNLETRSLYGNRSLRTEAGDNLADDNWHHLVVTKEGTTGSMYLDGELIESKNYFDGLIDRDQDLFIGRDNNEQYNLVGDIDDIRFYTGALSSSEVKSLYNNGGSTGGGEANADGNSDGKVDLIDYVIWYNGYGTTTGGGVPSGDYNLDGSVNIGDYVVWFEQFQS